MFSFLKGIRVLEMAILAPGDVGKHLADFGAEVIKVEQPNVGDSARAEGYGGLSGFLFQNWNRGKKSLALNTRSPEGIATFMDLAKSSHVVIDGMRAGAAERMGVGYEVINKINPSVVYLSFSGFGQTGPYRTLGAHGMEFDAIAGLMPPVIAPDGTPRVPGNTNAVGSYAGPLYGALSICAALIDANNTGKGQYIDACQTDAAIYSQANAVNTRLNDRPARVSAPYSDSVRYQYYETQDDGIVFFMPVERHFFKSFCESISRPELYEQHPGKMDYSEDDTGNEVLRQELVQVFKTRTRAEWVQHFLDEDLPGGPVYKPGEVMDDPHFQARDLIFDVEIPDGSTMRFMGPPVKVLGETFDATFGPDLGQHTDEILSTTLGYSEAQITKLREDGTIQ